MTQVLVIDDQATFRRAVSRILRRIGYVVHEAADGESGLAELAARPGMDLMLVDCRMPGISGLEVIAQLRRDRRIWNTKVIMVTALDDDVASELALMAGADAFLSKPFTEPALVALLDQVGLPRKVA